MFSKRRFGYAGNLLAGLTITLVGGLMTAYAIEPTELEPAEGLDAGQFQLELKGGYEDFSDGHETALEAELSYGINDHLRLGVNIPYEWEEDDDSFGDVGAFLEFVCNPESTSAPVFGGELKITAPTGEDSDEVGGELQLRLSKSFAEKHGLHLTLKGYYESVDDDNDHDLFDKHDDHDNEFGYTAVLGYTYQATEATRLIADVTLGEAAEEDENNNLVEVGLTHAFSDAVEIGVGVGAGLDDDSPDFVAHAGIEFKFGGSK